MMTLDEAIKHAEEVATKLEKQVKPYQCESINKKLYEFNKKEWDSCLKCASEHKQLADWLKELKQLREQTGWIPVSERLPMPFEFVNCTCHSLIDNREDWVIETGYIPQPPDSPYSDWGNIPMLNSGDCEVVAWMHRNIPKPYKAESEE